MLNADSLLLGPMLLGGVSSRVPTTVFGIMKTERLQPAVLFSCYKVMVIRLFRRRMVEFRAEMNVYEGSSDALSCVSGMTNYQLRFTGSFRVVTLA